MEVLDEYGSGAESWLLWNMCRQASVNLQLGSDSWCQELHRGTLQGTSFSADLFARTLDFFLTGLVESWAKTGHDTLRRFDLPHLLLYADDILLFGDSSRDLQRKLHDLQKVLSSIGLFINVGKCEGLQNEDGTDPGVWPLGSPCPLRGAPELLYLGAPLSHNSNPMGQLGVSLSKMSSSFFALRKLFDHPDTPVKEKLQLFRSYIASKWTWCSPAVWPTLRSLKSLESFKHTMLLSLLKLDVDPLIPFLSNTVSGRKAVKATCHAHKCKRWGTLWLQHMWSFWGHALRSGLGLPLHKIIASCNSFAAGRAGRGSREVR